MSTFYDDGRWGIEKVLTFQSVDLVNKPASTVLGSFNFTEDVTITEFCFVVTTSALSVGTATAASLTLAASGSTNAFATLTLATTCATGNLFRTTTIATPAFSSGSVLQVLVGSSASWGIGVPYIKYRSRF